MSETDFNSGGVDTSELGGTAQVITSAIRTLSILTPRQRQVILLLGDGLSCAEISRSLGIARSTVTLHRRSLMRKLGLTAKSDLLRLAVQMRLEPTRGMRTVVAT